jgi:hypothetical protein
VGFMGVWVVAEAKKSVKAREKIPSLDSLMFSRRRQVGVATDDRPVNRLRKPVRAAVPLELERGGGRVWRVGVIATGGSAAGTGRRPGRGARDDRRC